MSIDLTRKLPRPQGHHAVTPGFAVPNAAKVIGFLERAFSATLVERFDGPNGAVVHAEVMIGDSVVMLGEAGEHLPARPAMLSHYVDSGEAVDRTFRAALAAGGKAIKEPTNQFYGYRNATVEDPGGNLWTICAIVEELSKADVERRMKAVVR